MVSTALRLGASPGKPELGEAGVEVGGRVLQVRKDEGSELA